MYQKSIISILAMKRMDNFISKTREGFFGFVIEAHYPDAREEDDVFWMSCTKDYSDYCINNLLTESFNYSSLFFIVMDLDCPSRRDSIRVRVLVVPFLLHQQTVLPVLVGGEPLLNTSLLLLTRFFEFPFESLIQTHYLLYQDYVPSPLSKDQIILL
ncbi:hypothetical protein Tco_0335561 [Tanacetum coccineum]